MSDGRVSDFVEHRKGLLRSARTQFHVRRLHHHLSTSRVIPGLQQEGMKIMRQTTDGNRKKRVPKAPQTNASDWVDDVEHIEYTEYLVRS